MGLDNDADLKRLQEELKRERERKEKLEKEVREKVIWPLMSIFHRFSHCCPYLTTLVTFEHF